MIRYFYILDKEDQRLIQYNKSQESTNCSSRDIFLGLYSIAGDPERGHKEAESSWGKDTILFCVLSLACFFAFSLVFVFLCMPLCALLLVPACFGSFFSLCASLYFYFRKSMCLGMFVRPWMCVFILCLCVYLYPFVCMALYLLLCVTSTADVCRVPGGLQGEGRTGNPAVPTRFPQEVRTTSE